VSDLEARVGAVEAVAEQIVEKLDVLIGLLASREGSPPADDRRN
jgi:hypothetical protein